MPIDRTLLNAATESNGTPGHGTAIDRAFIADRLLDPIDAAISAGGALSNGSNYINDTANANMTVGLTINQGVNDNEILALKSSDIAHGMTDVAETDTYCTFQKWEVAEGGVQIAGYAEGASGAFTFLARGTTDDTTKGTGSLAYLNVLAQKKSGTSVGAIGANANIIRFANSGTTQFILDGDGDSHQNTGTAWTNFDTHDDVAVLNLLTAYVTRPNDPLRATFAHWLLQSRETLERLRLVTFNDDGHHFVNMSRLTMLLVGAVRQLGSRMDRLEQRLLALEA